MRTGSAESDQAAPLKKAEDTELASVKRLTSQLDRTFRVARLYGMTNQTSQKFVDQFYREMSAHLAAHGSLSFIVQGYRLLCKGQVVYENPLPTENLAFKLFGDGVRELGFNEGLSREDLLSLLEALGTEHEAAETDEDIVTCLWSKELRTILLVTAEEVVKAVESSPAMTPQDSGAMNAPMAMLTKIHGAETARQVQENVLAGDGAEKARQAQEGALPGDMIGGKSALGFLPAQFEVSKEELDGLARELEEESGREDTEYLLDMLTAILASERSLALLSKVLDTFRDILARVIRQGNWKLLVKLFGLLQDVERRPDLTELHKQKLADLYDIPAQRASVDGMAAALNASPQVSTDGLLTLLLQLTPAAVPPLCTLLSLLEHQEHRSVICEALVVLAKDAPAALATGLHDRAKSFVRDLIYVITRVGNPRLAESLEHVAKHQDDRVRKEAVRTFGSLCPRGNGRPLLAFLDDPDEPIRVSALKLLTTGQYTVPFTAWAPLVGSHAFLNRPLGEMRTIFQAMGRTCGREAVPYWRELLLQQMWTNKKPKQLLGSLAAEALGKLASPDAIAALETGRKRFNRAIRNACSAALTSLGKRLHGDKP